MPDRVVAGQPLHGVELRVIYADALAHRGHERDAELLPAAGRGRFDLEVGYLDDVVWEGGNQRRRIGTEDAVDGSRLAETRRTHEGETDGVVVLNHGELRLYLGIGGSALNSSMAAAVARNDCDACCHPGPVGRSRS